MARVVRTLVVRALLVRALVVLALTASTGCGLTPQARPEPIPLPAPIESEARRVPDARGVDVTLFFLAGDRLDPVLRPAGVRDVDTALELLAAGPTEAEAVSGLRTALPPQDFTVVTRSPLVTIEVSREFTGVTGGDQLRAVAQVVWTATQFPGVSSVRFSADGTRVEVPTDAGLTALPVSRADYPSVAPPPSTPTRGDEPPLPGAEDADGRAGPDGGQPAAGPGD